VKRISDRLPFPTSVRQKSQIGAFSLIAGKLQICVRQRRVTLIVAKTEVFRYALASQGLVVFCLADGDEYLQQMKSGMSMKPGIPQTDPVSRKSFHGLGLRLPKEIAATAGLVSGALVRTNRNEFCRHF